MICSESIEQLAKALAAAQAEMANAKKDAHNPHFKSQYADLQSVWDACRGPLTKNGLSVIQSPENAQDGSVVVTTRLLHISGQWIESEISAVPRDKGPQAIGSVITYLRRYSLAALVGVAPEDDDGNAATHPNQPSQPVSPRPAPAAQKAPRSDRSDRIKALMGDKGWSMADVKELISSHNVQHIDQATDAQWVQIEAELMKGPWVGPPASAAELIRGDVP